MAAPAAQAAKMCPRCGAPGVWHAQVSRWGCDRCRQYLDAMQPAFAVTPPDVAAKKALAARRMGIGALLLVIGVVITVATHDEAESSGGGTYIIAYGPMIVGGIRFLQGLFGLIA